MALLFTLRALRSRPSQHRREASFVLRYAPAPPGGMVVVGRLDFDGQFWVFKYDDEYRRRKDLRPIEGFDDLERTYTSSVLFPFFAVRIPDVDRDDVKRVLEDAHVSNPEPVDLLRLFGRRAVSSPAFELLPA